jgi:hypothetical protein
LGVSDDRDFITLADLLKTITSLRTIVLVSEFLSICSQELPLIGIDKNKVSSGIKSDFFIF